MNKKTYEHMLGRMQKDFIAMQLGKGSLEESLRQKHLIVENEVDKQRKSKEQKLQSKQVFDSLMRNIEQEQKERQERIMALQKSIQNKEESVRRRMENIRRQQEIAEAAANENKDSTEKQMRNNFMV